MTFFLLSQSLLPATRPFPEDALYQPTSSASLKQNRLRRHPSFNSAHANPCPVFANKGYGWGSSGCPCTSGSHTPLALSAICCPKAFLPLFSTSPHTHSPPFPDLVVPPQPSSLGRPYTNFRFQRLYLFSNFTENDI